jgi:signal transduction histidine kinase/putative methionine-R-sulfoxide reductase with GAF domain
MSIHYNTIFLISHAMTQLDENTQVDLEDRLRLEKLVRKISTHFINLDFIQFHEGLLLGLELIANCTGTDQIAVCNIDPEIDQTVIEWQKNGDFPSHTQFSKQNLIENFQYLINQLKKHKHLQLLKPEDFQKFPFTEQELFKRDKVKSILFIPLFVKENLVGWISFSDYLESKNWNDHSIEVFNNIANIFINVFERGKYENKIQNLYLSLEQKINEKTNELTTLLNIQKALTSELHVDHVIQIIADEARRLTQTQLGTVYFFENGKLILKVISGERETSLPIGFEIPIEGSLAGVAFKTGSPFLIDDVTHAVGAFKEAVKRSNVESILFVPLISGRKTIGVISVADKINGQLGREDERLLKMFANSAIIALDNARLYKEEFDRREEAERRRKIAEALRDILRMLNSKTDIDELLNYIAAQSRGLLNASSTMIRKINYESNTVITEASSNLPEEFSVIQDLPFYSGGSEIVLRENKPVVVSNLQESLGRYLEDPQELSPAQRLWAKAILRNYKSHMIVPLIIDENLYGTMTFYYINQTTFSEEDIYIGLTLASQVSLAIENARLRNQEKEVAIAAERNRLARDLHDAVTQTLFSATLIAEVIPKLWKKNAAEGERRLEELRQLTRGALAEMRTLLLELRPTALKDASFSDLIKQLSEALSGRTRIPVEVDLDEIPELEEELKIALYRISQEAFNNIAKHANANLVKVKLHSNQDICMLIISDDGKGMNEINFPSNHLGIGIMKERAVAINSVLEIDSKPGIGTTVTVKWKTVMD